MFPNDTAINPVATRWSWPRAVLAIGLSSLLLWGGVMGLAWQVLP
jgi:hypothetical protein